MAESVLDPARPVRMSTAPGSDETAQAYRAFVSFPAQREVKKRVIEQLHTWLHEKKWDPSLADTGYQQREGQELFVLHHDTSQVSGLRVRMREQTPQGEWRTELTVTEPRSGDGRLAIEVTNSQGRFVDVPRIAGYVLDVLHGFDGPSALTSEPALVSATGVDELAEELCADDRAGLVFVAGTAADSTLFPLFRSRVARWTRQVRGLGRVVVLDPRATEAFSAAVGSTHDVAPWTIRTYHPAMDPAVMLDGRRHRVLGIRSLAEHPDGHIERILGRVARAHAATRPLPDDVVRISRALDRLEARLAVSALDVPAAGPDATMTPSEMAAPATPTATLPPVEVDVSAQAGAYLAQVDLVRSVLGLDSLDEPTLRALAERARRGSQVESAVTRIERQLAENQARLESLEDEVVLYREIVEDYDLELGIAEHSRGSLLDEVRWLRDRLARLDDHESAYGTVPQEAYTRYPESFEDLLTRVDELAGAGLVFSADRRPALALDAHDTLGKLARSTWDSLLVIGDYLRARREAACSSGLDGYISRTPDGFRHLPPGKFAGTETSRTMKAYGAERLFPVPPDVSADGLAIMKAHFKLGRVGMVSPRMYVLDRYPADGRVYVGYLGVHLTNTKTN